METRVNVTRSSMPPMEEYFEAITPLWGSHWLTNRGELHRELERQLSDYLRVSGISLFTNGHSALEAALEALGLVAGNRRKVITTPFTFSSTIHAIVRRGFTPVFCDVRPDNLTLDAQQAEELIDDDTFAILPVHVYGNLADVDAFEVISEKHSVKLIYDAAHAFGVCRNGVSAAAFGDASMFSFHATKVFNTIEGGAVTYNDPLLGKKLEEIKNFGINGPDDVVYAGCNEKMDEFRAAMGICNLRHLGAEIAKRAAVEERYRERLSGARGLRLLPIVDDVASNHAYMPVLFDPKAGPSRDEVYELLAAAGFGSRKYFAPLASEYSCYARRFESGCTPVAEQASRTVLTLPMYADLTLEDVDAICGLILGVKGN